MKNILYLGNQLSKHGKNPTGVETLAPKLAGLGYGITTASGAKNPLWRLLEMWWKIITTCRKTDVVLIDTYSTLNFYYALSCAILCRGLGLPYIPILHGGQLPERMKKNPVLCKQLFGKAQINIAPSAFVLEPLRELGISNLRIIPNFIDTALYPYLHRERVRPRILWVRAFKKIYRPEWALQAAASLKEKGYEVKLCMVGPALDNTLEACKQLAEEKQLDVEFSGKLSKTAWIKLSEDYDIFLNTSSVDHLPVSVLEALALGLWIVSAKIGGLPTVLENEKNVLYFHPNKPAEMCNQLLRLLQDNELAQNMAQENKIKTKEFQWETVSKKWQEVFKH